MNEWRAQKKSGGEDVSDCGMFNEQFVLLGATTRRGNILGFRSDQVGRILLVGDGSKRKHEDGRGERFDLPRLGGGAFGGEQLLSGYGRRSARDWEQDQRAA